jgi:WD40 repeat protein
MAAVGVREFSGAVERRFGYLGAALALLACLVLDVLSAWFIFEYQAGGRLPIRLVPAVALEYWRWEHLLAYGLSAGLAYYLSFEDPARASPPRLALDFPKPMRVLFTVLVCAFVLGTVGAFSLLRTDVRDVATSANGRTVAVVQTTEVNFWGPTGRRQVDVHDRIGPAAWSADTETLAVVVNSDADIQPSKRADIHFCRPGGLASYPVLQCSGTLVNCVALSPDGQTLATGDPQGGVRLWQLPTEQGRLRHAAAVTAIALAPAGDQLAAGLSDGTLALWDLSRKSQLASWSAHGGRVLRLAFGLDGRTLFSACAASPEVRAWATPGGHLRRVYPLAANWVTSLALSPDGGRLAVGGGSFHRAGAVCLFDVNTGQVRERFTVPANTVSAVAFSPDGQTLFAGTRPSVSTFVRYQNGRVHRWDLFTGQELPSLD